MSAKQYLSSCCSLQVLFDHTQLILTFKQYITGIPFTVNLTCQSHILIHQLLCCILMSFSPPHRFWFCTWKTSHIRQKGSIHTAHLYRGKDIFFHLPYFTTVLHFFPFLYPIYPNFSDECSTLLRLVTISLLPQLSRPQCILVIHDFLFTLIPVVSVLLMQDLPSSFTLLLHAMVNYGIVFMFCYLPCYVFQQVNLNTPQKQ